MIRLACADDLDAVDAIYDAILTLEEARPVSFTNWQRGKYPTLDHARRAMEEHTLWKSKIYRERTKREIIDGAFGRWRNAGRLDY